MSDLYDRLFPDFGSGVDKIPIHQIIGAITDYIAGETSKAQIIAAWSLDSEAQTDLNALTNTIDALSTKSDKVIFALEFDAVCLLAEAGLKYTTKSAFKTRLGIGS